MNEQPEREKVKKRALTNFFIGIFILTLFLQSKNTTSLYNEAVRGDNTQANDGCKKVKSNY